MKREPAASNSLRISSRAPSSIARASRLSRSGDRLIKRICAKPETLEKALSLYESLKDSELHSKGGVPVVCAYVASTILGNGDVTREPAEVTSALGEVEFMERLQEVRRELGKSMPTVSYKALILTSKLENSDGLIALMQAVENVLVIPPNLTPSRDTVILAVFHWTCNYLQAMPGKPKDEVLIENFDIDGETFEALLDALSSTVKNLPLLKSWRESSLAGNGLRTEVSVSVPESPQQGHNTRGQKRKHSAVGGSPESPLPQNLILPPRVMQPSSASPPVKNRVIRPNFLYLSSHPQTVLNIDRSRSSTNSSSSTLTPSDSQAQPTLGELQLNISSTILKGGIAVPRITIPQPLPNKNTPNREPSQLRKRTRLSPSVNTSEPSTSGPSGLRLNVDGPSEVTEQATSQGYQTTSPTLEYFSIASPLRHPAPLKSESTPNKSQAALLGRAGRLPTPILEALSEEGQDPEPVDKVKLQLAQLVHKATWDVVNHVDNIGCSDVTLKLKILDLKTRMVELVKAGGSGIQNDVTKMLHESIRRRQEDIVRYGVENSCGEISLKLKILDVNTRLSVMVGRTLSVADSEN